MRVQRLLGWRLSTRASACESQLHAGSCWCANLHAAMHTTQLGKRSIGSGMLCRPTRAQKITRLSCQTRMWRQQ